MKRRTLILRLWRDAANVLTIQVSDPLGNAGARVSAAEELWAWLEASVLPFEQLQQFPSSRREEKENEAEF